MNIPILSSAYFPNTEYCKILSDAKEVIIDQGEHFIKQSQRSRCEILGPNGILKLIVPLKKRNNHTMTKDIRISYADNWQKLHWKSLESAYRSSPYFEYYEDRLDKLVNQPKHEFLIDLNREIFEFTLSILDIDVQVKFSSEYLEDIEDSMDFRNSIGVAENKSTKFPVYTQVFGRNDFTGNLSIIDLICNEGPNAIHLLH